MPFTFIDLFAGIGGTRQAFESFGGKCIFSSEIDNFAQRTYFENFNEIPEGDITKINMDKIPKHDILVAGFPCQPFSLAGVSKRNSLGRPHGLKCEDKGVLFYKIVDILKNKEPNAFFLENVKHLYYHNNRRTYRIIKKQLNDAGYDVFSKIIDASLIVPQHRERIYIVGFKKELKIKFTFPIYKDLNPKLNEILEKEVEEKYTLSDKLWKYLQYYKEKQKNKGNGFGYGLADLDGVTRTLSSRYWRDGAEILVPQINKNPRRLTPRECARLMGFRNDFKIPVSDHQAYIQFGNSVVVPLVKKIAGRMIIYLSEKDHAIIPVMSILKSSQFKGNLSYGEEVITMISLGEEPQIHVML